MNPEIEQAAQKLTRRGIAWMVINLVLGLVLWIGISSDLSWNNVWLNVFFAPAVGVIGLVSLLWLVWQRARLAGAARRILTGLLLPSILGGIPHAILIVLAIFPPMTLATLFWLDEQADTVRIQHIDSPDGARTAEVFFSPVGAYSGGSGRIHVQIRYRWLPLVKRDVYYLRVSDADEGTRDYVTWVDNDVLHVSEEDKDLRVEPVQWHLPWIIAVPISLAEHLLLPAR